MESKMRTFYCEQCKTEYETDEPYESHEGAGPGLPGAASLCEDCFQEIAKQYPHLKDEPAASDANQPQTNVERWRWVADALYAEPVRYRLHAYQGLHEAANLVELLENEVALLKAPCLEELAKHRAATASLSHLMAECQYLIDHGYHRSRLITAVAATKASLGSEP